MTGRLATAQWALHALIVLLLLALGLSVGFIGLALVGTSLCVGFIGAVLWVEYDDARDERESQP